MRDKLRPAFRISIHALREEGDGKHRRTSHPQQDFYPRPPRGGRPKEIYAQGNTADISIHALREEGDPVLRAARVAVKPISIHALREEGDLTRLREGK